MRDRWFKRTGDEYVVHGNSFHIKDQLKAAGGRWDGGVKVWRLGATKESLAALRALRVPMYVKVMRAAFCHTDAAEGYAVETDADRGYEARNFCLYCDSQHGRVDLKRLDPVEDAAVLAPVLSEEG